MRMMRNSNEGARIDKQREFDGFYEDFRQWVSAGRLYSKDGADWAAIRGKRTSKTARGVVQIVWVWGLRPAGLFGGGGG